MFDGKMCRIEEGNLPVIQNLIFLDIFILFSIFFVYIYSNKIDSFSLWKLVQQSFILLTITN
jgi:hypothetical protein